MKEVSSITSTSQFVLSICTYMGISYYLVGYRVFLFDYAQQEIAFTVADYLNMMFYGAITFGVALFFAGYYTSTLANKILTIGVSFTAIFWLTLVIALAGIMNFNSVLFYNIMTMIVFGLSAFVWPITMVQIANHTPAQY